MRIKLIPKNKINVKRQIKFWFYFFAVFRTFYVVFN